jgi:hypothetical protein
MASNSRKIFDQNLSDIDQLIQYYQTVESLYQKQRKALPTGADVVLRSAWVLLVTYWEAYLEDIASEALEHLVKQIVDPDKLPKELKKIIAKELIADKNDLAVWALAANGWRTIIQNRLPKIQESRNRSFNTPKSAQTRDFFCNALGIKDITTSWVIGGKKPEEVCKILDRLVELRGQIAHRGKLTEGKKVNVKGVEILKKWIKRLVAKTGGRINTELKNSTGVPLWKEKK